VRGMCINSVIPDSFAESGHSHFNVRLFSRFRQTYQITRTFRIHTIAWITLVSRREYGDDTVSHRKRTRVRAFLRNSFLVWLARSPRRNDYDKLFITSEAVLTIDDYVS